MMRSAMGHAASFAAQPPGRCDRKGFALAAALLALLLIAALIPGVFYATTDEARIGTAARERQLALS
ncbi:MAG TPA: hypothetical protein VE052_04235, partial [Gemmatimonadaceae bacterium]|nr:hypothetical protein [Gemmatimonadaceae bacterium]